MSYYIADTHFGHANVIRYDTRPFETVEAMNETLIQRWNARVGNNDTVYVLGDAFWGNEERRIQIIEQLTGHTHLIVGNHDRTEGMLRKYWESIAPYAEITDGDITVILSHYPMLFYKNQKYGTVMLYGHVHKRNWAFIEARIWIKIKAH